MLVEESSRKESDLYLIPYQIVIPEKNPLHALSGSFFFLFWEIEPKTILSVDERNSQTSIRQKKNQPSIQLSTNQITNK